MSSLLEIRDLRAWYGASQALHGVNLRIEAGEAVALAGRNGSGRSTLAKAIMGMVRTQGGMKFSGKSLAELRTFEIARLGIGYVPEQRDVFPTLSVRENLLLGTRPRDVKRAARFSLDDAYTLFPVLRERAHTKAGALSGGEQQMLCVARALLGDPDLVVIDEPAEGLAGQVVTQLAEALKLLRGRGVALLLIEQRLVIADRIASRIAVMGHGEIVFDGTLQSFRGRADVIQEWLGVG
ncbi:ABC transporter ATP-binding protein [Paraburkholderia phymatum]|uniref:ABC transporter related n=1 Tax=Paraburkholderia phymatum (strain DSM 17167 / CIP 108236 / LMG 21445 / STM815) TaxID=391038 RepID=B2JK63_PARP8|nr:ABC transporter ATP-binding protein [Paraburkholderia phymatum]ACC70786.1 ABC transporter related [Paraburkholderia phymatum STM815]